MVPSTLSLSFVGIISPGCSGVLPLDGVVVAHPLAAAFGANDLPPRLTYATQTNRHTIATKQNMTASDEINK